MTLPTITSIFQVEDPGLFGAFWSELGKATLYKNWKRDNPGEVQRLAAYAAGGQAPTMSTAFGRALVTQVTIQLSASAGPITIP